MGRTLEIRILGPLEVRIEAEPVRLGGARQRSVLAVLALHAGGAVSLERLVDSLWGDGPPATATTAVYGHIAALRKLLGPDAIATRGGGYVLDVDPDAVDAQRFARLVAEATNRGAAGVDLLVEALALWRGEALADVDHDFFGAAELARLTELRLTATEQRIDADLAAGRHAEVLAELEGLTLAHPLRERLREQLMRALYRAGRQADALRAYQVGRQVLARELGIEPGVGLQELEARILRHDASLIVEPVVREPASTPRILTAPAMTRKFATALFADLVGFTALTEREDPEVVQALLTRTFDRVTEVIGSFGGTVENVIGDAVLAMFGVPAVHEDDPLRAVRAALEILRTGEADDELRPPAASPSFHIGIEAGEVLVHDRTDHGRQITGDAVNTAARLQAAAAPGSIVVGPTVYALTKGAIDYRRLAPLTLKGKAEPVPAFVALRATAQPAQHPDPLRLEARLVGRDLEVQLLEQVYSRMAVERRPALVTVFGPAGVGKSRLAVELLRRLEAREPAPTWRKGRCRAYGDVSYSALTEAVRAHCGILDDDPTEVAAEKAGATVERLFGSRKLAPQVEALVGGSDPSDRFGRDDLFDAWRRFLERAADPAPMVLVLEDIHWADAGLLDFVDHIGEWGEGPILVLALARPELLETRPGWGGGKRSYTAVYLDPLSRADTEAMVADLLGSPVPPDLMGRVAERAEGNPLFVEEIVRMLIDRGVVASDPSAGWGVTTPVDLLDIPRSVQAVIAARIDALPEQERVVLQTAAVVGRTFWGGAAQHLAGADADDVKAALAGLRAKELIVRREPATLSGEVEYAFRHVLIRDVAYDGLAKAVRADKHMELAQWALARAGERRDDLSEFLATHCVKALGLVEELGQTDVAPPDLERQVYTWARAAGVRALRLWQQPDAIRWFEAALSVTGQVQPPPAELAALWESYGRAGEEVQPYEDVARAFQRALDLYERAGADRDAARVETRLAFIAHQLGDRATVVPMVTNALARLERLGDSAELARALHVLGWHQFRETAYGEAEPHLRRAVDVAARVSDEVTRGHALVSLAFVLQQTGRGPQALRQFEEALTLARRVDDVSLLLRVLTHICGSLEETPGDYERAKALAREANELARRAGNVRNLAWSEQMLSDLAVDTGHLEEAYTRAQEARRAAEKVGEQLTVGYALHRIAYLHAVRGEPDEAARVLAEARPILAVNPEPWLQGWDPLIDYYILQARNDDDDDAAARLLWERAGRQVDRVLVWGGKHLLLECVRSLVRAGRAGEVHPFVARLHELGTTSVPARTFLRWADGLVAGDAPTRRNALAAAVEQLTALGQRVDVARCLFDLAAVQHELGEDAVTSEARGRRLLHECGAVMFLREAPTLAEHG